MISRRHAILSKSGDRWTIKDNKSMNGVYINGTRLKKDVEHTLTDGEQVQIGVGLKPGQPPPFVWVFKSKLKVKKLKKTAEGGMTSEAYHISSQHSVSDGSGHEVKEDVANADDPCRKRHISGEQQCNPSVSGTIPINKKRKIDVADTSVASEEKKRQDLELLFQQKEQEDKLRAMQEQQEKIQAQLKEMQEQKDKMEAKMVEEMKRKEQEMAERLQIQEEELHKQKEELQQRLKVNYEKELKEKEKELLCKLSEEKKRLLEEKCNVERSLQNEMERKLEEKDKDLEEKLKKEKENLERIIDQKETEQQFLISELDEFKEDNEKQKENAIKTKEAILSNFADLMETELQCSICSELFIKATSLNCSHSFCSLCIEQWMDVKKQCPVCRTAITSHLHSIVLDSYIDRMVEHLTVDMKDRRKIMIDERKEEMEIREKSKRAKAAAAATTAAGRGRGRGRGYWDDLGIMAARRSRGGGVMMARRGTRRAPAIPMIVSDDDRGGVTGVMAEIRGSDDDRGGATSVMMATRSRRRAPAMPLIVSDDDSDSSDDDDNSNNNNTEFNNTEEDLEDSYHHVSSELDSDESQLAISSDSDWNSSVEGATGEMYYGGYGTCFSCGRRGHWANDCPSA